MKINNRKDIKNCFRYIENNKVIASSVELLYRIFMSEHGYEKCSGYELAIVPLRSIQIICIKNKYEKLLNSDKKISDFIEKYKDDFVTIIEDKIDNDIEIIMEFYFNINEIDDSYHKQILPAIAAILGEIFSLCDNDIVPLQIALTVYNDKNLRLDLPESEGMHRVFAVFKMMEEDNTKKYTGYYYDPEGQLTSYYAKSINNILDRLRSKNVSLKYINDTCPLGIQGLLKDVDIGLCTIYSHFWFHCFIQIIYGIKKYDRKYKTNIYQRDITKYFDYINQCIVKIPYNTHLLKYKNYKPNLDNNFIIDIYFNYAMYIIGLTFTKLKDEDKKYLLEYIKLHDNYLVK